MTAVPVVRRLLSRVYRSGVAERIRGAGEPLLDTWIRLDRVRRRRRETRAVLLVAETPMMLDHALEGWQILGDLPHLQGHLVVPRRFRDVARQAERDHHLVLHRSPLLTRLRWWDLLITANHIAPYSALVPSVRLQHGMDGVGKVLHGQGFTYGPRRVIRKDGTPVYTRILESSEWVRRQVVHQLPELADTIVVVGNLTADRVRTLDADRAQLRARVPGGGPVVAIMSTFGAHSLVETMGSLLFAELVRLRRQDRFRFVVLTHPNLWAVQRKLTTPWDERLLALEREGIVVARPGEDWRRYVALADVAVSDHTSVCIPYALLGRPLITVPVPDGVLLAESVVAQLHRNTPTLGQARNLEGALSDALGDGLGEHARAVAARAVSFPGEAADRIHRALVDLLDP